MKFTHLPLKLFLLFTSFTTSAQINSVSPIHLKSGTIRPGKNISVERVRTFSERNIRGTRRAFSILQFDRPIDDQARKKLKNAGIELVSYIPDNAWSVVITKPQTANSLENLRVSALVELEPEQKMDALLLQPELPGWATKVPGTIDVSVSFPNVFSFDSVQVLLASYNFNIVSSLHKDYRVLVLRVLPSRLTELAGLHFIEFVQAVPPPNEVHNLKSVQNSRANVLKSSLSNEKSLTGRNVVVGVGDESDPLGHIDIYDRVVNLYPSLGGSGHGVHVMGTVGGAGIVKEQFAGYAPKATLISQRYSDIFFNAAQFYSDYNMRITNNSYGTTVINDDSFRRYDLYSSILDQQMIDMPLLQHVFAAGNSGEANYTNSPYYSTNPNLKGFGTVLRSYQVAKNVISVANTDSTGVRRANSSRGPTADGRMKPEIAAEGVLIMSTYFNHEYRTSSGTSMAAPAVSGGLALLHEQYKRLFPSSEGPPNALMKALVCNAASELGNDEGPDFSFGYGWLNLTRASEMLEKGHYRNGTATTGQTATHTITVPAETALLKVMLYWNDPPPSPITTATLINDLDLQVTDGTNTTLPYILNSSPSTVSQAATRGVDRVNNMEQVVIANPSATNYTIKVIGHRVTNSTSPQKYYVVYDFIPKGTTLHYPYGGEKVVAGDVMGISWDSYGPVTNFDVEFYNGNTWSNVASDLTSEKRRFYWTVPTGLATDQAKIRIKRKSDNTEIESRPFTILGVPTLTINSDQCEGYISTSWSTVSQATGYEVMRLQEGEMKSVAILPPSQTSYLFEGLSKDTTYWVTVRALLNGSPGRRAEAKSRKPDGGDCSLSAFDNDLTVEAILSPKGPARAFTSTALTASHSVKIRIKNLDNASFSGSIPVSYAVNNVSVNEVIADAFIQGNGGVLEYEFVTKANLSTGSSFKIDASVNLAEDTRTANNSISSLLKVLSNPPVSLSISSPKLQFIDESETILRGEYFRNTFGIKGSDRYDFYSSNTGGRLRTFIYEGLQKSGNTAFTLDALAYPHSNSVNTLDATFNLANYTPSTHDIRLDFAYNSNGYGSAGGNKVWIRGSDTDPWIEIYDLYKNQEFRGTYKKTESLEINDFLTDNGQTYSSSTQIRWGQEGAYPATSPSTLGGTTFDDVRLYLARNDIQLLSIDAPTVSSCVLGSSTTIKVTVRNSMGLSISSIPIRYRIDGGNTVSEVISSIGPNTNLPYEFTTKANLSGFKTYSIEVWVDLSTDEQTDNNRLTLSVTNTPVVNTFPYFQDFESGRGNWFTSGTRSSWEWGTPASQKIAKAASGTKAWKTRLSGNYNDDEESYLYSPCLNISGMTNPTLSFLTALDLESCEGDMCDGAYVEYSYDGANWSRLGAHEAGTNWYNKNYVDNPVWSIVNYTRWHVATISLPLPTEVSGTNLRLRFVMSSDLYNNREGIAIDDIHIYDHLNDVIHSGEIVQSVTQTVSSGNAWTNFVSGGQLIASINPSNYNLGSTQISTYLHEGFVRYNDGQYYMNRNFTVKPTNSGISNPVSVRLYFSDSEAEALINANGCSQCTKPASVLDLGINKYNHPDKSKEDATISNNNAGSWTFIAPGNVTKRPYGKGYYAEFSVTGFSEFWLSTSSMNYNAPLPVKLEQFTARKGENSQVILSWSTTSEVNFSRFEIEVAMGNEALKLNQFYKIGEVFSQNKNGQKYNFTDESLLKTGNFYYRLKMVDLDETFSYSDLKSVIFENGFAPVLYPNPSASGIFHLAFQLPDQESISYRLIDMSGKVLREGSASGNGFIKKERLDISNPSYSAGIYLLETTISGTRKTFRLVKQP